MCQSHDYHTADTGDRLSRATVPVHWTWTSLRLYIQKVYRKPLQPLMKHETSNKPTDQLSHDDSLDESERICQQRTQVRRRGLNAPVGSRDPVYNFLCCWAIEVDDKWRHNDVVVEKVISIDQNSRMESVWSVSKLSIESVGTRQSSWASCEFCSHRRRWRDSTRHLSRVGVGGVQWALKF